MTATPTSATLDAVIVTSPSPSASASSPAQSQLCVSVQRAQTSIQRGQKAGYAVTVSTVNGPVSDVSVTLTSQPASQKPTFTSGCAKGNGKASCAISSIADQQPVKLQAQIAVASGAKSVSSVKLTATASIVTTEKWTPPAAAETVTVTSASPSPSPSPSASASPSSSPTPAPLPSLPPAASVPLGPLPNLNGESSSLIGAGNASDLFPAISPSPPTSSAGTGTGLRPDGTKRNAAPVSNSSVVGFGAPVLTAQVAGLLALAVALLLTMTRLSLRRRSGSKGQGS